MLTSRKNSVVVVTLGLSHIVYVLLRNKCQARKGGMYYYSVIQHSGGQGRRIRVCVLLELHSKTLFYTGKCGSIVLENNIIITNSFSKLFIFNIFS